jgi:ribosomal protein L37AE/L43A
VLLTEQSSLKTFPLFTVKATVVAFEHKYNNYYAGCPFNKCLRKVFYQQSKWKCNHCNKAYDKPQYYFSIKITKYNMQLKQMSVEDDAKTIIGFGDYEEDNNGL